jgi:hypothetical protein
LAGALVAARAADDPTDAEVEKQLRKQKVGNFLQERISAKKQLLLGIKNFQRTPGIQRRIDRLQKDLNELQQQLDTVLKQERLRIKRKILTELLRGMSIS